jgi:acyl carrier protein
MNIQETIPTDETTNAPKTLSAQETLKTAFATALGVSPDADIENMKYGLVEGWDSVAHMALIAEIEGAFDIMMSTDEVIDLSSFAKAKEIVASHGVRFES